MAKQGLGRNVLDTPRMALIPSSSPHLQADLTGREELAALLGVRVPPDWPPTLVGEDRTALARRLDRQPTLTGWLPWYWVAHDDKPPVLVGLGGFGGPPDQDGCVSLSYSVVTSHQRRGYATEAVGALVSWALGASSVQQVEAEPLPRMLDSIAVLERTGFVRADTSSPTGLWRFVCTR